MAVVILGGLVTSTLLSLFVVPFLYLRFGARSASRAERRAARLAPAHEAGSLAEGVQHAGASGSAVTSCSRIGAGSAGCIAPPLQCRRRRSRRRAMRRSAAGKAPEGETSRIRGQITKVEASAIVVKTGNGKTVRLALGDGADDLSA